MFFENNSLFLSFTYSGAGKKKPPTYLCPGDMSGRRRNGDWEGGEGEKEDLWRFYTFPSLPARSEERSLWKICMRKGELGAEEEGRDRQKKKEGKEDQFRRKNSSFF